MIDLEEEIESEGPSQLILLTDRSSSSIGEEKSHIFLTNTLQQCTSEPAEYKNPFRRKDEPRSLVDAFWKSEQDWRNSALCGSSSLIDDNELTRKQCFTNLLDHKRNISTVQVNSWKEFEERCLTVLNYKYYESDYLSLFLTEINGYKNKGKQYSEEFLLSRIDLEYYQELAARKHSSNSVTNANNRDSKVTLWDRLVQQLCCKISQAHKNEEEANI